MNIRPTTHCRQLVTVSQCSLTDLHKMWFSNKWRWRSCTFNYITITNATRTSCCHMYDVLTVFRIAFTHRRYMDTFDARWGSDIGLQRLCCFRTLSRDHSATIDVVLWLMCQPLTSAQQQQQASSINGIGISTTLLRSPFISFKTKLCSPLVVFFYLEYI